MMDRSRDLELSHFKDVHLQETVIPEDPNAAIIGPNVVIYSYLYNSTRQKLYS